MKRILILSALLTATSTSAQSASAQSWTSIQKEAQGQTVNFYMWGGSDDINKYVDTVVAPAAKKLGVTLRRVPVSDTVQAVNKVLGEKQAGKNRGGSVDMIWINGENFKTASQARLLLTGWSESLPNAKYVNWKSPAVRNDFGFPVNGAESPWGSSQWQYVYDSSRVKEADLPRSFKELATWTGAHPGRFTFPAPPNFSGNRFLRQAMFELAGGQSQFVGAYRPELWARTAPKLWTYLRAIQPNLWRGGQTFPADVPNLYSLFANGEIDFAFVQNIAGIAAEVKSGVLPTTARVFIFDAGTVTDTHYVAIPYNSAHSAGAKVVANLMLTPELQLAKLSGNLWGDGLGIDPARVGPEFQKQVKATLKVGPYTLDPALLSSKAFSDVDAQYDKNVQDGFKKEILK
ncbi:ABC transporter substrate-binding protein [Deinococcus frigens]|uniref:ABC transporter substrate-binding protein n=1 Tax=Deinococcus frigens TaxID=249403 RepID=UPI000497B639|nr:ABC transporter substrate-binding protein [Deinococcus frigens]